MSWTAIFNMRRRSPDSPLAEHADEVDDELMFHLQSLVDDNLAAGMPADLAWQDARDRFGSLRRYADACRSVSPAGWLLSRGSAAAGLFVVALLVGWLLFEVRSLRREHAAFREAPAQAPADEQPMTRLDIAGRVLDRLGEPIAGADVVVVLKTWPGGRYRQDAFAATSDRNGRFRLPGLVPSEGQVAVQAAALKDGYALASTYQLKQEGGRLDVEQLTFRLDAAPQITLVVQDEGGRPVAGARVVPASRRSRDGESHLVYFQASEPLQLASDADGRVGLACFERGDLAEIYVQIPGGDWQSHSVNIPSEGDRVAVSAAGTADGDDPSRLEDEPRS